jgi:antitoxin component YwqK of YwqJK toxin-antitoxin module
MKNFTFLLFAFLVSIPVFSQKSKIDKIKNLYVGGDYLQCIDFSQKIIEKDSKNFEAYFYTGFSYFGIYKSQTGKEKFGFFKNSLKNISEGKKYDKENTFSNPEILQEIHDTLRIEAYKYYQNDKEKSKPLFNFLVKIYKDTTDEYLEFYEPGKVRPDKAIVSQMEKGLLNQTDENGLKQGHWQKVYDNGNIAYDVFFKNNEPTGIFKRFHKNGNVESVLIYQENSQSAKAEIYDENGVLTASGKYLGKEKDSIWNYYNTEKRIIRTEEYHHGKLNGKSTIFYKDGAVYDEKNYRNGKEDGLWTEYYINGNKLLQVKLTEGKRNGTYTKYYTSGETEIKGNYLNDLPEGTWEYFSEKGKKSTLVFKNGHAINEKVMNEKESELYKKTMIEGSRIIDPQNFMSNPEEYNRQIIDK